MTEDKKQDDQVAALPGDLQSEADALLGEIGSDAPAPEAATSPADDNQPSTADMASMLLNITLNGLVAPRAGEHWKMSEAECGALGKAYGAVIDKYFPDLDLGVEFVAVMVTFTVFGPRVAQDVALRRQAEGEAANDE